uniref:Uncharacterized protein n=1 Tax=Anguilla anguilla TaxID=7936 RepID=A0A0E9V906_ANGAN
MHLMFTAGEYSDCRDSDLS